MGIWTHFSLKSRLVQVFFALSLFSSLLATKNFYGAGRGSMMLLTEMLQFALLGSIRPTARVDIDGDFIVGGLFPVHEKGNWTPCGDIMEGRGLHRVAAMIYAIERINNDSTLLPGIKLGAKILDTCAQPNYALNMSLEFVKDLIELDVSSNFYCSGDEPAKRRFPHKPLVGVIGASYSSVSTMVANLLRLFHVVQISPASTSPELSDKTKFEYFARTVPSDVYQAQVLADVAAYFNWTYVSVVFSEAEYGSTGSDRFKEAAAARNICIALDAKVSSENVEQTIHELMEKAKFSDPHGTGARIVVLFTRNDDTKLLLLEAQRKQAFGLQWLAADAWETTNDRIVKNAEEAANGAIIVTLASRKIPDFDDWFIQWHPSNWRYQSSWFIEFWETKFKCYLSIDSALKYDRPCNKYDRLTMKNLNPDDKVEFVIDAVYALAHALHMLWADQCRGKPGICPEINEWKLPNGKYFGQTLYGTYLLNVSFTEQVLLQTLNVLNSHQQPPEPKKSPGTVCAESICRPNLNFDTRRTMKSYLFDNVSFVGIAGHQFEFNEKGDGPAFYLVKNYRYVNGAVSKYEVVGQWIDEDLVIYDESLYWPPYYGNKIPHSRCSVECSPGHRKASVAQACCWVCVPCSPNEFMRNETACEACPYGYWPTPDRKGCYNVAQRNLQFMEWASVYSIVPCCLAALGIILTLTVILVFVMHNKSAVVKASGRELSYILLVGMLVCYSMTFVIIMKPDTVVCGIKRVGIGFGFAILYAALLVKTNRIYRIFSSAKKSAARPRWISPMSQVAITLILIGVQLVASGIWLIVKPPATKYAYPDPQPQAVLECQLDDHWFMMSLLYDAVLIIACTVYAVLTRQVPENFNEAKFIGFTMYTTCIIWLAFIPIYFGTGNNFRIQLTTLCISVSLSSTVALFCLYAPKLWIIYMEPEKNTKKPGSSQFLVAQPQKKTSSGPNSPSPFSPLIPKNQRLSLESTPTTKYTTENSANEGRVDRRLSSIHTTSEKPSDNRGSLDSLTSL